MLPASSRHLSCNSGPSAAKAHISLKPSAEFRCHRGILMRPTLSPSQWPIPAMRQTTQAQLGANPLIESASPLLRLALHLRQASTPHAEAELYQLVSDEILALELPLVHQGFDRQTISDFRYLLCCVL